jgi:hypothetical protein
MIPQVLRTRKWLGHIFTGQIWFTLILGSGLQQNSLLATIQIRPKMHCVSSDPDHEQDIHNCIILELSGVHFKGTGL